MFDDQNQEVGVASAYWVTEAGHLIMGWIATIGGKPVNQHGQPLKCDNRAEILVGWPHSKAISFENGTVLVP